MQSFNKFMDWLQAASYLATAAGMIGLIWAIHKNKQDTKFQRTEKSLEFLNTFMDEILPEIKRLRKGFNKEYKNQENKLIDNTKHYYEVKYKNNNPKLIDQFIKEYLDSNYIKNLITINAKLELGYDRIFHKINMESIYINKKMVITSLVYPVSRSAFINFYDMNQDVLRRIKGDKMSFKTLKKVNKSFKRKRMYKNLIITIQNVIRETFHKIRLER